MWRLLALLIGGASAQQALRYNPLKAVRLNTPENLNEVTGQQCHDHCECGSTTCSDATADTEQRCYDASISIVATDSGAPVVNETYGPDDLGCCVAEEWCKPRCTVPESAVAADLFLTINNFTSQACSTMFALEETGDPVEEMELCKCIKEGLDGALAGGDTTVEDYDNAVEDLQLLDCRAVKGNSHTLKDISSLCISTSARDDPVFSTGMDKIKFWLPDWKQTSLLEWATPGGTPAYLTGDVFNLEIVDTKRGKRDGPRHKRAQWFKRFYVNVGNETVLTIKSSASHYKSEKQKKQEAKEEEKLAKNAKNRKQRKFHKQAALAALQPEDPQSFMHVELDGQALTAQGATEKPIDHVSADGSIKVELVEYAERHIGNMKAEKVTIKTPKLSFTIWSNKAGKFRSEEEQVRYAHLNFEQKGPFPSGTTGFFAEMSGVSPMSNTTKKLLRVETPDEVVKMTQPKKAKGTAGCQPPPGICARDPRAVMIDVGSGCGHSLTLLQEKYPHLRKHNVEFHAFEANPTLNRAYMRGVAKRDKRVSLHEQQVWTEASNMTFYLEEIDSISTEQQLQRKYPCAANESAPRPGQSELNEKGQHQGVPVSVESIDFASWMCQMQLCDHDAVFVKLSMEGAEYGLLNQLNSDHLLCKADKWFVDWNVDTKLMPHADALKKDIIKAGKQCWHKKGKFESLA